MANKICKLTTLITLFFTALCFGATSSVSNITSTPTKTSVSYTNEETNYNDHTHDGWTSLTQSDFDSGAYTSGSLTGGSTEDEMTYFYLDEDIELTSITVTINNYVALCLNGHKLSGTDDFAQTWIVRISSNAYLKLYDCSDENEGFITGNTGGGITLNTGATFDMYGGSIKDSSYSNGGGVYSYNSTFNMYGGTISGNTASERGGGVNVVNDSIFNMYGGSIENNVSTSTYSSTYTRYGGGGLYVNNSTFNMYGGTISDNSANYGGGVIIQGGTFSMFGGSISDNTATTSGGNVFLYADYSDTNDSTFDMYAGTISNNNQDSQDDGIYVDYRGTFNLYSGHLNNQITTNSSGTYTVTGGYFTYNPSSYISSSNILQVYNISAVGADLDDNYQEGYNYAIYTPSSRSYLIYDVDTIYGTAYEPVIDATYTSVAYSYSYNGNTISGLPTYVGEYTVTAYFLNRVTEDNISTNYYATRQINVTITKGQAEITINSINKGYDGETASIDYVVSVNDLDITTDSNVTWYDEDGEEMNAPTEIGTYKATITVDCTDNYDGRSVNINYTITNESSSNGGNGGSSSNSDGSESSSGAVAVIVIVIILVIAIIVSCIYFFFFRKKSQKAYKK